MKAGKCLSALSAFLIAGLMMVFSGAALAQTVSLNGTTYPTLAAAVAAADAAGTGTITLSAGTFEITSALYLDGTITVQGAVDASGTPTSIITYDDTQTFELANTLGSAKYLISISNYNNPTTAVNFTNIKFVAGAPTQGCTVGGGAAAACTLGALNYVVQDVSGTVKGTITNSVAVGGTVGLVTNNKQPGAVADACEITVDGFEVSDHSWGGANLGNNTLLILGNGGLTTGTAGATDTAPIYTDGGTTANVQYPDGSVKPLAGGALFIMSFDPNGGNFGSSAAPKQVDQNLTDTTVPGTNPTRSGYTFAGWFSDAAATIPLDTTLPVLANGVAYAGWLKNAGTASVPTTSETALILLGMLLAGLGVATLRRKYQQ